MACPARPVQLHPPAAKCCLTKRLKPVASLGLAGVLSAWNLPRYSSGALQRPQTFRLTSMLLLWRPRVAPHLEGRGRGGGAGGSRWSCKGGKWREGAWVHAGHRIVERQGEGARS